MWSQLITELRPEILLRVGLTLITGFILGVERERHGRAAGLRTTLLVSLSSCIVMLVSDAFYISSLLKTGTVPAWHPDPARLAAGALSGMGFIGAGVIIRQSNHIVRGVTTAATLWLATIIGLSFGAGAIGVGILGSLIAVIILHLVPYYDSRIQEDWYSGLSVRFDAGLSSISHIVDELKSIAIKIKSVEVQTFPDCSDQLVVFRLKYKKGDLIRFPVEVTERLRNLPGVHETHWHA